jgi:hypothetical protein
MEVILPDRSSGNRGPRDGSPRSGHVDGVSIDPAIDPAIEPDEAVRLSERSAERTGVDALS